MIIRPNNLKRFIPVFVFSLILISSTFSRGSGELFPGQNTNQAGNPGSEEFGLTRGELVRAIEEVERLISQYMNEAGFEYIANDFQTVRRGMAADKTLPGMSERQFFQQYGYGISTLYTGLPPQLSEFQTSAKIGLGRQNIRIYENLSPEDQIAYNYALLGENWDATLAVALETEDFSRIGGATKKAIQEVFLPEHLQSSYYNPRDAMVDADPRMIEAMHRFATSLREAGFNYSHEKEIEPDLRDRLWEITKARPIAELSPEERWALEELQNYERSLASVAYTGEIRILDPVADRIEYELFGQ
jgi:hypothetical protein